MITTTLHYMDSETASNNLCNNLFLQTRPISLSTIHTKRISKLKLISLFKSFADELIPFQVWGSNTLNDWVLLTYQQSTDGMDIFTTRIMGNYKYFILVFASGKNTLIQQIDFVYSERFTQTFR